MCLAANAVVKCAETANREEAECSILPSPAAQILNWSLCDSVFPLWPFHDWHDLLENSSHDLTKLEETGDEDRHGRAKEQPFHPPTWKKAQHYYFTTEWRLGIREVRLSRRATPDIFSVKSYMWHFKNPIIHLQILRHGVCAAQKVL